MRVLIGMLLTAAVLCAAPAVVAQELMLRWFDGGRSWSRTYHDAELRRWPEQRVRQVWLRGAADDIRVVRVGFVVDGRESPVEGTADCRNSSYGMTCETPDGGKFRLSGRGCQLVMTLDGRWPGEDALGARSDRTFPLERDGPRSCRILR